MKHLNTLSNSEAWERLPPATLGNQSSLPSWARTLAGVVPKSTAMLLELDYAQRKGNPIKPELRAAMRWVIADANGCEYSRRVAQSDLVSIGPNTTLLKGLITHDWSAWPEPERSALQFAKQMSLSSNSISDESFASLGR